MPRMAISPATDDNDTFWLKLKAGTGYTEFIKVSATDYGRDSDGDGISDAQDAFPNDANETLDSDGDAVGDNADVFPNDPNETLDSDGDGVGNNSDYYSNDASKWRQEITSKTNKSSGGSLGLLILILMLISLMRYAQEIKAQGKM